LLTRTYTFETPELHQRIINSRVFDVITMPHTQTGFKIGEPNLPTYGVSLLLPQGSQVEQIIVNPGLSIPLGNGYQIAPVEPSVPISDLASTASQGTTNEALYASDTVFPSTMFTTVGVYHFRGYDVLQLLLNPIQYHPRSGRLSYFIDMTITVTMTQTGVQHPLFRGLEKDRLAVARKIDNLEMLSSYQTSTTAPRAEDSYDLLIFTTDAFKDAFLPLKTAHENQGLRTEIKTPSDVYLIPHVITAEDLRDFIRTEYLKYGIDYVLIGGDSDIIPAPMLYVEAQSDNTTMPSDFFYSCLDGTFNYNENDAWGEPHDGDNGGDVDLLGEVYVGRAPVGNLEETAHFIQKTITAMNSDGYSTGTALMVGEYLWGPPDHPLTFGDDYMEELINGSTKNMYTTVGIPATNYSISKLYDRTWPGFNLSDPWNTGWPSSAIIDRINNGTCFVNHLGHAGPGGVMGIGRDDVTNFTNTILPFIYSQGCYAGAFDNAEEDCIAEFLTVKTAHAAFAVIMCARYGWGTPGSTNGPNQRYHRYFWDAVFGDNITTLGKANQDSKEENIRWINSSCMRWCYYEMNLLGDPALDIIKRTNAAPQQPAMPTGAHKGTIGQGYTFSTMTTDRDNDLLYYQWSFGDGTFSHWLGPYHSGETVNVTHTWSQWGRYTVKVKARDEHRLDSEWSEPLAVTMPYVFTIPFIQILIKWFARFPHTFPILRQVMGY